MKMKPWLAASLVLAVSAMTAACASKPESGGASGGETTKENEKFTITAIDFRYGTIPPANGKGIEMINERFNVDYKPQYVVQSDYVQKLSAVIASGDIPDIIVMEGTDSNFYKWAKQGAFLPLNEYMDKYETFKLIPDNVRKAVTINGNIYAIQRYLTENYELTPVIRKDWLDNLGLKVPTNYEELKEVAIAFTKNDPDGNGKDDTYGMAMSQNINPHYGMGAYWDWNAWYHKNEDGQFIPGFISEARKQHISFLADLYKEGAISKDFALLNWAQTNKEFYSGKAGIFIGTPRGMNSTYMQGLVDIDPKADIVPIPPFEAPDGSKGFTSSAGYYGVIMLNAKLKDQPAKVEKILEMIDFGRKFYPLDERKPDNTDFDWMNGHENNGYKMVDGNVQREPDEKGLAPFNYMPDNRMWAPNDLANGYSKEYPVELLRKLAGELENMHNETKHYINPMNAVFSETRASKGSDLDKFLFTEQTKMIVGERPISDWDKMVQEWMDKGGAQIIKEANEGMKENGYTEPQWK